MATTRQQELDQDFEDESRYILPPEEGRAMVDREARRWLGISGEELLRRWDAGEYRDIPDTPEGWKIMDVVTLIPFARQDP